MTPAEAALAAFLVMSGSDPGSWYTPRDSVERWAYFWGIPGGIAYGVAREESGFNPIARSEADARGVVQVKDAEGILHLAPGRYRWWNSNDNARVGFAYLRYLRDRFGSWSAALHAYNMGPTRYGLALVGKSTIPESTRDYVRRIL